MKLEENKKMSVLLLFSYIKLYMYGFFFANHETTYVNGYGAFYRNIFVLHELSMICFNMDKKLKIIIKII